MNWMNVVAVATVWVIAGLVGIMLKKYIIPWLKENRLFEAAVVAVEAAEAMYGRYNGQEKLKYALLQLKLAGWDIDTDVVMNAVRAAWQQLDLSQMAAGVKYPPDEEEPKKNDFLS